MENSRYIKVSIKIKRPFYILRTRKLLNAFCYKKSKFKKQKGKITYF